MTHPLTDEMIESIALDAQWAGDIGDTVFRHDDMRAVADWQLEQVIEWFKKQTDYSGTFYYEALNDIETIEDALMSVMRPQEES